MNVIDLHSKLNQLQSHVNAKRLEQRKHEQERTESTRTQRAADWARMKDDYPDHAELITALAKGFGKPARVRVMSGGETILDSMRYE